jgi:hypothetical protein
VINRVRKVEQTEIGYENEKGKILRKVNNPVQSTGLLEGPHRATNSL